MSETADEITTERAVLTTRTPRLSQRPREPSADEPSHIENAMTGRPPSRPVIPAGDRYSTFQPESASSSRPPTARRIAASSVSRPGECSTSRKTAQQVARSPARFTARAPEDPRDAR